MSACRSCGTEVTGNYCPRCGSPVLGAVPWPDATASDPAVDATVVAPPTTELTTIAPFDVEQTVVGVPGDVVPPLSTPFSSARDAATDPYGSFRPPVSGGYGEQPNAGFYQQGVPSGGQGFAPVAYPGYQQGYLLQTQAPYQVAKRRRPVLPIVVGVLVLALLVVGFMLAQRFGFGAAPTASPTPVVTIAGGSSTSQAAATSSTISQAPASTTSTAPVAPVDPEAAALNTLRTKASAQQPQVDALVARQAWVAQLASKYVGIPDAQQMTSTGSHIFLAADILAEHQTLVASFPGTTLLLADSTTFGNRLNEGGQPYWRTLATSPSFTSEAAVKAWCAGTHPGLSGEALANRCYAVHMS